MSVTSSFAPHLRDVPTAPGKVGVMDLDAFNWEISRDAGAWLIRLAFVLLIFLAVKRTVPGIGSSAIE
jgi:hypothetical protein